MYLVPSTLLAPGVPKGNKPPFHVKGILGTVRGEKRAAGPVVMEGKKVCVQAVLGST